MLIRLAEAKRPVILAGTGIRAAQCLDVFQRVIHKLQIPVVTAWTHDTIDSSDPLFCGRQGTIGDRAGNFTVQGADVLLILGSSLGIRQIGYNWGEFAPGAFKIWVDIDPSELNKPTVKPDLPVCMDLRPFLEDLEDKLTNWMPRHQEWLKWCRARCHLYPVVQPKHRSRNKPINPYHFIELLFDGLTADDVIVCGNATACIVTFQAAKIKLGQILISNSGSASMGYDIPAAIGAAIALPGKRVICLAGDGSAQFNIQELQTIRHCGLAVKILILNNGGYLSMRQTQDNFFGRRIGESPESGVSFPDYTRVAAAYQISAIRLLDSSKMADFWAFLDETGPGLCEVMLDPDQEFEPRPKPRQLSDGTIQSPALHDLYPFLPPEEVEANVIHD